MQRDESLFENGLTRLYTEAVESEVPTRFIAIQELDDQPVFINAYDEMKNKIERGDVTGEELVEFQELFPAMEPLDIAMTYFDVSQEQISPTDIIKTINDFYSLLDLQPLAEEIQSLKLFYEDWAEKLDEAFQRDSARLDRLLNIQEELDQTPSLPISKVEIETVTIVFKPIVNQGESSIIRGVDLFDRSQARLLTPYIRYNGQDQRSRDVKRISKIPQREELFKIYKGETQETQPDYTIVIPEDKKLDKDNRLYMSLWTNSESHVITKPTKDGYTLVEWDLSKNSIKFQAPKDQDLQILFDRIEASLPITVPREDITERSLTGNFYMYGIDANDIFLVDAIQNDDIISSYLFVKEDSEPYATKKQIKIYYRDLDPEGEEGVSSSVVASINQLTAKGGETVELYLPENLISEQNQQNNNNIIEGSEDKLSVGYPYIRVRITRANTKDELNKFLIVFSRLLSYYNSIKEDIQQIYITFIPEIETQTESLRITTMGKKGRVKKDSKNQRLREQAPELIVEKYARFCQCPKQPIIIPEDEVESWKSYQVSYGGKQVDRPVLAFPPDNPRWNFVCPGNIEPFISLKKNSLANKEQYPYFPCCGKDANRASRSIQKWGKEKKQGKTDKHKHRTDKILKPGRFGFLPQPLTKLLSSSKEFKFNAERMGVPRSINSLLHCVSIAVQDPNYISLKTEAEREDYVQRLRLTLIGQIQPSLLKQEFWDYNIDEIQSVLADPDRFFDPNLFYRIIEETYKVQIWTFGKNRKGSKDDKGNEIIQFPRFKLFGARTPKPNRQSILIYRTWGGESDSSLYPQCELIIDNNDIKTQYQLLFGPRTTQFMYNSLNELSQVLTWIPKSVGNTVQLVGLKNIYSRIDWYTVFGENATSQYIDSYGKLRALTIGNMTVIIPASQPLNLPMTTEIQRAQWSDVQKILAKPDAITLDNNGQVDGVWFDYGDIINAIYIPLLSQESTTSELQELIIGPENPLLTEEKQNITQRVFKMNRQIEYIVQTIVWLYMVSGIELNDFIQTYIGYGEGVIGDSATIYDFSNLQRKFPYVQSVEEAIEKLSELVPNLISEGKVFLYSEKFMNGIIYQLIMFNKEYKLLVQEQYQKDIQDGTVAISLTQTIPEDFGPKPYNVIFTNRGSLNTWLRTIDDMTYKNLVISQELDSRNNNKKEPYMYISPTGKVYLIQNVSGGNFRAAIKVALDWYTEKNNRGYVSLEYEDQIPVHVIYSISAAKTPQIKEDLSGGNSFYLQILDYGDEDYAALLPLS